MSAVEEIQAAIGKLTELRGGGPTWALEGGDEWISPLGIDVAPDDGGVSPKDARLIVTLHRTIDAQLAVLTAALGDAVGSHDEPGAFDAALVLASAINGTK